MKKVIIIYIMTDRAETGFSLADPVSEHMLELEAETKRLLLDSSNSADLAASSQMPLPEGAAERQASYVLDGGSIGEEKSRYVAARISSRGLQAAMAGFIIDQGPEVPVKLGGLDLQAVDQRVQSGPFTFVDFFGFDIGAAIRLEGVETLAGHEDVDKLLTTMRHPDLQEISDDIKDKVRYTPLADLISRASHMVTSYAERYFLIRKFTELSVQYPEGSEGRKKIEAKVASIKDSLPDYSE